VGGQLVGGVVYNAEINDELSDLHSSDMLLPLYKRRRTDYQHRVSLQNPKRHEEDGRLLVCGRNTPYVEPYHNIGANNGVVK
jgi:hypothetical protein